MSILIVIVILMIAKYFWNNNQIDEKGVFVIGHLTRSKFEGSETGWMHYFRYSYNSIVVERGFGGPMREGLLADSVAFIKILPDDPSIAIIDESQLVPKCFKTKDVPSKGWLKIPVCQ
jgi:hypothetical protein